MAGSQDTLSISVKFEGAEKLGSLDLVHGNLFGCVQVDQRLDCPDYFALEMNIMSAGGAQEKDLRIIEDVKLGMGVAISVGYKTVTKTFEGEVSYIEPAYHGGSMTKVTVAGYDLRHRLTRGTQSRTFGDGHKVEVNFGDTAATVIGDAKARTGSKASLGLSGDAKASSSKAEYLAQIDVSDYQFLESLGISGQVRDSRSGTSKSQVTFKPLDLTAEAKVIVCQDLKTDEAKGILAESAEFSLSSVRQVSRVEVRGWDVKTKKAFVGKCEAVDSAFPSGGKEGFKGAAKAHFGSEGAGPVLTIIDRPVVDVNEANELAKAIFNSLAMQYLKAEIVLDGRSEVQAGDIVEVKGFGKRFNGKYGAIRGSKPSRG